MNKKGLLLLLIAATAFSTLAIFMKVAFGAGVNLTTLLAFRFLFSSLLCFFALTVTQKKLALPVSQWWRIFALGGVVHVLVSIFYAISVQRLPASLTGLIFYLYPAMVTGLALLIGSLLLVMSAELLNSAVEAVIERFGPEHHELAGRAKDMGSAAVFVLMLNVLLVWGLLLWPRLVAGGG